MSISASSINKYFIINTSMYILIYVYTYTSIRNAYKIAFIETYYFLLLLFETFFEKRIKYVLKDDMILANAGKCNRLKRV